MTKFKKKMIMESSKTERRIFPFEKFSRLKVNLLLYLHGLQDLEEGFLQAETEDGSAFLLDLLCRLLNGCYGRKDITYVFYILPV